MISLILSILLIKRSEKATINKSKTKITQNSGYTRRIEYFVKIAQLISQKRAFRTYIDSVYGTKINLLGPWIYPVIFISVK
jgi:hypothetical protein